MARQTKPKEAHHAFSGYADNYTGDGAFEIVLSKGPRPYLWIGPVAERVGRISTYSGPVFLRKLAKAILKEVGAAAKTEGEK